MIIIPELKKVLLMPPRTASTEIKRLVLEKYPKAFALYRHGEATMVPPGYDSWEKVGLVRDPLERLFSLYNYCKTFEHAGSPEHAAEVRASVFGVTFEEWVFSNQKVFANGFGDDGRVAPAYFTSVMLPENRKPQWWTLRPDLGTCVMSFDDRVEFCRDVLDVQLEWMATPNAPDPSPELAAHMKATHYEDYWLMQEVALK